jgi:tetratricopeptide (TPR) repeat protein
MLDGGEFDGMAAIRWLEEAVLLDPRQPEAVNLAVRLRTVGVTLRPDVVALLVAASPAAEAVESGPEAPERALQRHLMRVLSEGTVGELNPDVAEAQQVSLLVQLLRVLGAEDEAGRVADQLLERLAVLPVTGVRNERRVEILLAAGRFAELRVVLQSLLGRSSPWNTAPLQRLQGLAIVAEYDVLAGRPSADWRVLSRWLPPLASGEEQVGLRLKLLEAALANTAVVAQAIDRLSREVLAGGGTRPGAERLLTQLQSTGRNVGVIWTKMAGTAAAVGRYSEAVQWYRKSLQLTSERGYGVLNNLAFCLIRSSGVAAAEEAFALVQEGLQQAPDHPALLATRGEILLRQGLVVRARADLERALELNPGGIVVQTLLRELYEREGDRQGLERLQGLHGRP